MAKHILESYLELKNHPAWSRAKNQGETSYQQKQSPAGPAGSHFSPRRMEYYRQDFPADRYGLDAKARMDFGVYCSWAAAEGMGTGQQTSYEK